MNFELHFKSIAVRWFINVFLTIAAVIIIAAIALSLIVNSLYVERIKSVANDYACEYETLSSSGEETFEDNAIRLSDRFIHKNKLEVQVIDKQGNILVTTTGFQPEDEQMPDFEHAMASSKGTAVYKGKTAAGEPVLACTNVIKNDDGDVLGAYRWITTLENANAKIFNINILIVVISLAVLGICSVTGLYFITSIIRPIRDVSNTARKIAMGDFKSRIELKRNDEIGELCDTINYMAAELSQAENLKNDFISSVSHELRTPLTAIRGWGETAKMSIDTDPALVERGLDVVLSEADRLSGLVEELLDFSRMQTGRLTVVTAPVDISELLGTAVNMYTELAKKQGIELSFTPPVKHSAVLGDPDRLKQVFINIIDNAVKYTEKGGLVLVIQSEEEGCVKIVVKDTGVGIPAQDIDHVKEKFFKSNKTVHGSGIGLAVADEIIKQHKGLLFLESSEGVGTTVTIVLPLLEETVPEPEPTVDLEQVAEEITAEDNAEALQEQNGEDINNNG